MNIWGGHHNEDWPAHAAVDGKVDRVGEADERVDDQHDVLRHLIVQEGVETEKRIILKTFKDIYDDMIMTMWLSDDKVIRCHDEKPIRECVQGSDNHEGGLRAEEDPDHNDQHQRCALSVTLTHLKNW